MTVANPQIWFTNLETAARTGIFHTLVPWSTGQHASLAPLQTGKRIEFDGTTYDVKWSEFGPRHRDGSVRWSVAEFEATIPPSQSNPGQPTVTATIVDGVNTEPVADFSEFDALWADFEISLAYTDPRNSTSYTLDLLSVARAGTNNATYTETTRGLKKTIRAEAYWGRGRHYELDRAGGYDTNSAAVLTYGNLHAQLWFEVYSGQKWGHGVLRLCADAHYPLPSEPPDGGARSSGDHGRPTILDYSQGEQLDDPLNFSFTDASMRFHTSRGSGSQFVATRFWYTENPATGSSCFGQFLPLDAPIRETFRIPIAGLSDTLGFPMRFTTVFDTASGFVPALEYALHPYTYCGIPTHDTWMGTTRSGTMPAPYDTDTLQTNCGWEMPLLPIPPAVQSQWYSEGPGRYNVFLRQDNNGRLSRFGWAFQTFDWPWQLLGRTRGPGSGGVAPQIGIFAEGRQWLCGSVWDLYIQSAHTAKELGGARGGFIWKFEDQPLFWDDTDENTCYYVEGSDVPFHTSKDCKGRHRTRFGGETWANRGSFYNGSLANRENPEWTALPRGLIDPSTGALYPWPINRYEFETWDPWEHAHYGMRHSYCHVLLTQDQFLSDMVEANANLIMRRFVPRTFFGKNGADETSRAEARGMRAQYHAWMLTGKDRFKRIITLRLNQFVNGTLATSGASRIFRWNPWPILADKAGSDMTQCEGPGTLTQRYHSYSHWQCAHFSTFLANFAIEWSDTDPDEMAIAVRMILEDHKNRVKVSYMIAPGNVSAGSVGGNDACYETSRLAQNTYEQGEIDRFQCSTPRFFYHDEAPNTDPWSLSTTYTRYMKQVSARSTGEVANDWPVFQMADAFADFRADAVAVERHNFLVSRFLRYLGADITYAGHDSSGGYASDKWRPASTITPPIPIISASPRGGLSPLTVTFDGTASFVGGTRSASIWRWWFEYDGSPASPPDINSQYSTTVESPTHVYTSGSYTVRLEIEDEQGQSTAVEWVDFIVVNLTTGASPVADFTADVTSGTAPLRVVLSDLSSNNPTSWLWNLTSNIGVVLTSTEQSPVFFLDAGTYTVTLTASNVWGNGTFTRTDYITATAATFPTAFFTVSPGFGYVPPALVVTITNLSTNATQWAWNFGDGTVSFAENPGTHTYTTSGVKIIELIVQNEIGDYAQYSYRYTIGAVSGVTPVPVEPEPVVVDGLQGVAYVYDVTAVGTGSGAIVGADFQSVTAMNSDGDGSWATGTVNPSVAVTADFQYVTAINEDEDGSWATGEPTGYAFPDLVEATATQWDVVISGIGTSVTVTPSFQRAIAIVPGTVLSTTTAVVSYDAEVDVNESIATASAFDTLTGTSLNVRVQVTANIPTAVQFSADGRVDGAIWLQDQSQVANATVWDVVITGAITPTYDLVELRGSVEAPVELTGSA